MATILFVINILFAMAIIFLERKEPSVTVAWIAVVVLIPGIGIVLYLVFSQNIAKHKIFKLYRNEDILLTQSSLKQIDEIATGEFEFENASAKKWQHLIRLNQADGEAYYTQDNKVEMITDGREKMARLFHDVANAKESINIEYFIVKNDKIGNDLLDGLIKRAREGVNVRLLVDALGSWRINREKVASLREAGGEFAEFFPTKWKFFNNKINYRNHRKLVVIDKEIGYIGGFNIAEEYVGLKKKFGYWRDTHVRIEGSSVFDLNARFLLDWRSATNDNLNIEEVYFEPEIEEGNVGVQIVSSGPDNVNEEIKRGLLRMITSAKKNIFIQTPYFVPDTTILQSLKMAAQSGIDVRIMIPSKPDHMFVYWATYSYVSEIIDVGGTVYIYDNGFLHAKTMTVDGEVCTVGSTNFDRRSFKLNFEANAFIYDKKITKEFEHTFDKDIQYSHMLTKELYEKRGIVIKIKEAFSRILSDIL